MSAEMITTGLYLSGRAEALINQQPGVAGYQAADTQFSQALATVGRADVEPRDLLDAIVCSAIISFGLQRPEAVIAQLGGVLDGASRHPEGTGVEAWTAVRVLQGELVKGKFPTAIEVHIVYSQKQDYPWKALGPLKMPRGRTDPYFPTSLTLSPSPT